jgi:predicted phage terminase large subunit-like protein
MMNVRPDTPGKLQLNVQAKPATADKFIRAQPVAAAWNAGRIFLPPDAPRWAGPFVSEMRSFTGIKDSHDDQIDALAAAYDALSRGAALTTGRAHGTGQRRGLDGF